MSFRSGVIALAGRPNVGKSTIANALAGLHVAAVSPRPQTTRRRVTAVVNGPGHQVVLIDLPGFQKPADRLTARMQATVDETLPEVDGILFVLNAAEEIGAGDRFIARRLAQVGRPVVIALNQVDRLAPERIGPAILAASELVDFVTLHPTSAVSGDGLPALAGDLAALVPAGEPLYPPGVVTDQGDEDLAGELIREAALARLREEIPHAVAVEIDGIEKARKGVVVRAAILVETESQKRIAVGRGGSMVREIGTAARESLARLWGTPVHLDLMVKVRSGWRQDDDLLGRLGL